MNLYVTLILLILFPAYLAAQDCQRFHIYFEIGDSLTATASSGLNLRSEKNDASEIISVIPFGDRVEVLSNDFKAYGFLENRRGRWIKVNYGNQIGYVFSAFLSNLKIPELHEKNTNCSRIGWIQEIARANADSSVYKGHNEYKGYSDNGKDWTASYWEVFSDETIIYERGAYESSDVLIESTEITLTDILDLLEHYIATIEKRCPERFEGDRSNHLIIDTTLDEQGRLKSVRCDRLWIQAERSLYKTIIRLNMWDL